MSFLKQFLESSTIHGLVYISTESKFARFFWFLVVITGFTIASLLINDSFANWAESPLKTTTEKRSISELTFPKVTVCPPKNTFTDLNYDLMMLENMTFSNKTRQELLSLTFNEFENKDGDIWPWSNIGKLEEENRFYNWYHGYTKVQLPFWNQEQGLNYGIFTSATTGSIKTQYFGDKYDPDKIERQLYFEINIYPPDDVEDNPDYELIIEVEKVSVNLTETEYGYEDLEVNVEGLNQLDPDLTFVVLKFPKPGWMVNIQLERNITEEDVVNNNDLESMPGFKLRWYYNQVVAHANHFEGEQRNKIFRFSYDMVQSPKYFLLTVNRPMRPWRSMFIEKVMQILELEFDFHYHELQLLFGRTKCEKKCKMSKTLDYDKHLKLANHPVHIVDDNDSLSPSALIPFCWYGRNKILGRKHDRFSVPVCSGFNRVLRYDQICYEFNPGDIIKNEDIREGLHLIVDDNQDLMMNLNLDSAQGLENNRSGLLEYHKADEKVGTKVYLDAIG